MIDSRVEIERRNSSTPLEIKGRGRDVVVLVRLIDLREAERERKVELDRLPPV